MTRCSLLLLLLVLATAAQADNVVVPVAGARADLVLTNLESSEMRLLVTYYGPKRERAFRMITAAPHATAVIDDLPSSAGMIRVNSEVREARFTARYGETPAIPVDALPAEQTLDGNAVTVANPWTIPASVTLTLLDAAGHPLGQLYRQVPALDILQLTGLAASSVRVTAQVSVYAWAPDAPILPRLTATLPPPCSEPAYLGAARPGRTEWLVVLKPGTDVTAVAAAVRANVDSLFDGLPGFTADLTPPQIAALRCQASVELIEQP